MSEESAVEVMSDRIADVVLTLLDRPIVGKRLMTVEEAAVFLGMKREELESLCLIRRNSSRTLVDFAGQIVKDRLSYGG